VIAIRHSIYNSISAAEAQSSSRRKHHISSRRPAGLQGPSARLSFWQRFKLVVTGLAIAVIAVAGGPRPRDVLKAHALPETSY
jgi:hypothetical protein